MQRMIAVLAAATALTMATSAQADVILADELADITVGGTPKSATIGSWDTVNGIVAPSTTMTFQNGTDGTTDLNLWDDVVDADVPDGEILPYINMTAGGWDTTIALGLDGATGSIDLTSLVVDIRLAGSSGGDNNTQSKSGQIIVVLTGSSSGVLGTVDPGASSYPATLYTRTVDLSSLPTLDDTEDYTLTIQARGTGWGHFKSLQALELNGDITAIPEPASLALLGLGGLMMVRRRRA